MNFDMVDGDIVQPIPGINSYLVNGDVFHDLQDRHRLQEGRNYAWTVAAKDRAGNVKMSDDTFTIVVSDQYAPELPALTYPKVAFANPQPTFVWNVVSDPSGVEYKLDISLNSDMTDLVASSGWIGITISPHRRVCLLRPEQTSTRGCQYVTSIMVSLEQPTIQRLDRWLL